MLVIDKAAIAESLWREYRAGVRVKIRPITKDDFRRMMREATKKTIEMERGKRVVREELDSELFDRLCYRHAIEAWEGFADPNGDSIPRSDENIELVCGTLPGFSGWVLTEAFEMAEAEAERKGAELKNSKASHDGSAKSREA